MTPDSVLTRRRMVFLCAWLPGLIALQSIPHTGALRTLFLLLGILHLGIALRTLRPAFPWVHRPGEAVWFALLTLWLVLQAAFLSPAPAESLSALAEEWGKLMLMAGIGLAVAPAFRELRSSTLAAVAFCGFFVHVLSTLGLQAWSLVHGSGLVLRDSLLGNYGYVSPFTTGAFAFLLADGVGRVRHRSRLLPLSGLGWLLALLATLAAEILLSAKAGQLMWALLLAACVPALVGSPGFTCSRAIAVAVIAFGLAIAIGASSADRWRGMSNEITAAIHQENDIRTLQQSQIPDTYVEGVGEGSFYLRISWAKIGLEGLAQHPLGLGYGYDAFGRFVAERYGVAGAVSSHSGWIDFALANGWPALALFLALAASMMRRGWQAFRAGSPAGLVLMLFTFHYTGRSALDGNLSGSRLTGFALVAGLLWALTLRDSRAARAN